MLKNLITAIIEELQLFFRGQECTIMFESDFDIKNAPTYTLPLILVCVNGAPDSYPLIGNNTKYGWNISIKVYTYVVDLYMDNQDSYTLLETTQDIQQHFTRKIWLNDSLKALAESNSLAISFHGIVEPPPLPLESASKGFEIVLETTILSDDTNWSEISMSNLEVIQIKMSITE